MKNWNSLPSFMRDESIEPFFKSIKRKWFYRFMKRGFDFFASLILLIILFIPSLIIAIAICSTSRGGPFFLQRRVGRYGKPFRIVKFRTMKKNSEGNQHITHKNDSRVTKVGKFLRKTHLDEFPQLFNVIIGQMSFVGTRPEVSQFVERYEKEWYATLLLRPGITSTASYSYDDEAKYLDKENADELYLRVVLPIKMKCNLNDIIFAGIFHDIKILWKTVF